MNISQPKLRQYDLSLLSKQTMNYDFNLFFDLLQHLTLDSITLEHLMVFLIFLITGDFNTTNNSYEIKYNCLLSQNHITNQMAFLTIFFIWLGTNIPQDYQQKFKECETQYGKCKLIGQKEQKQLVHKYNVYHPNNTIIQRADVLRLLVIQQYGGIYLDFDVQILDWNYLKMLDCDRDTYFCEEQIGLLYQRWYKAGNWMICSGKNTTHLKKLIDGLVPIHQNPSVKQILDYAGPGYIINMDSKYMIVYPNIKHCYHNNWTVKRKGECIAPMYSWITYLGSYCFGTMFLTWIVIIPLALFILKKINYISFRNNDLQEVGFTEPEALPLAENAIE